MQDKCLSRPFPPPSFPSPPLSPFSSPFHHPTLPPRNPFFTLESSSPSPPPPYNSNQISQNSRHLFRRVWVPLRLVRTPGPRDDLLRHESRETRLLPSVHLPERKIVFVGVFLCNAQSRRAVETRSQLPRHHVRGSRLRG